MSKTLNGELTVRVNDENLPVEVVFASPTPVRNLKAYIKSEFRNHKFIKASWDKGAKEDGVLNMVNDYCTYTGSEKKRNFKKIRDNGETYRAVQGWTFTIMIDHHLNTLGMKRFADKFMDLFSGNEKLPYVVFEARQGEHGRYLHIWVCDYEYTGEPTVIKKVRSKTVYRDKNTLGFCRSSHPNAELLYRKGDPVCDEHGVQVTNEVYFSPRKCQVLDRIQSSVYVKARQCVVDTYISLSAGIKPQWNFNRFHLWWGNSAKLNKIYQELNRTQKSMESHLVYYLQNEYFENPRDMYAAGNDYLAQGYLERNSRLSLVGKELKQVFRHYEGAFKHHHFTDTDGNQRNLIQSSLPRDRLLENIGKLWERFKQDMYTFVVKHNLDTTYLTAYLGQSTEIMNV